ncbi:hypothetical protein VpaJT1_22 [Vibrio phage VpaJT_1]|nr:hypothetical protein VpaJT1_22 [Vibrio phage VpaJT_1]
MTNLINKVAEKFNGLVTSTDTVEFSFGGDTYVLTDGTLYATLEDGSFLPGFKKVRTLKSVETFVALRA